MNTETINPAATPAPMQEVPAAPAKNEVAPAVAPKNEVAALSVAEVTDRALFAAMEKEWNALVARTRDEIFYRHEFIRIWIDNFAPEARLRIITVRDSSGTLVAALPLMEERTRMYGMRVRQLCATANPHSCRFDLIALDAAKSAPLIFAHLDQDASWDVLKLTDIPEGGNGWKLFEAAEKSGSPTGTWLSLSSPYIPLPQTFEELSARLQSKFKANVRRRRKKLEEKGQVTLEKVEGGVALDARLEEGFHLEAGGWKGERGTAMAQSKSTRGFYTELARTASHLGALSLYYLRVDGRAVAFHYGLTFGGRYLLLKPGYDEALKECSPGQLMMEEVLKDLSGKGLAEFDFLGPDMVWKRDWTDRVRAHTWLFIFRRTSKGRLLRAAKFEWVPAVKEAVAKWKR